MCNTNVEYTFSVAKSVHVLLCSQNKRGIMGLVTKTLQHNRVLNKLFENTDLLKKEDRIDADLASVLVTELIWGKKVLQGDSKPVQTILKYQERLLASVPVDDLTLTDECIQTSKTQMLGAESMQSYLLH